MEPKERLIAAVAMATHATSRERLLVGLADALVPFLDVKGLELGQGGDETSFLAVRRAGRGWKTSRGVRVADPVTLEAVRRNQPKVERRSREGPRPHLILPLADTDEAAYLAVWSGDKRTRGVATDLELLAQLAALIARGLESVAVVERVATVSRRAHLENRELRRAAPAANDIVAASPQMRTVVERARAVARYPTSVLLTGESGVGKERVAELIHRSSPRSTGPFVRVNCGALPESLAESELFGHEKGAFTGASRRHRGVFERAHRGSILLDEVGELTPNLQVKVLRVLQEGELVRVGGEAPIQVDLRVIAATNRNLDSMIRSGSFREDLFFRLAVYRVEIPPLRERAKDIPLLVRHLVHRASSRLGRTAPRISEATMRRLEGYAWPGNVRELENVLEAALVTTLGDELELPSEGLALRVPGEGPIPTFAGGTRLLIERALGACTGKIYGADGAAALLDLKPATLQGKMRKLGIERKQFVRAK